jgi:C1A family cysteine protease
MLASRATVAIGFSVYGSFEQTGPSGAVPIPDPNVETLLGGHAVLVCGYNDEQRYWIVRNQWNQTWGDGGYCYMPYGYEAFWLEAWTAELIGVVPQIWLGKVAQKLRTNQKIEL